MYREIVTQLPDGPDMLRNSLLQRVQSQMPFDESLQHL